MAATDVGEQQVVQKGEGPFDLLVRLGAIMGAITALLSSVQGMLDALRSREIAALLPLLIGLLIVLALVASISALTWFARRSRSAVVGFITTLVLAVVTTVLGLALAASALPHFGYQLALQRVSAPDQEFAQAPPIDASETQTAPAEEAAAPKPDEAARDLEASNAPAEPPAAPRETGAGEDVASADPFVECSTKAQADSLSAQALEEALLKCLTP